MDLYINGGKLKKRKADSLERRIQKKPDDVKARAQVMGYWLRLGLANAEAGEHEDAAERYRQHLLWVIRNAPRSVLASIPPCGLCGQSLDEARQLWDHHISSSPDDLRLLSNAVLFCRFYDMERGVALCNQGRELDPTGSYWPENLAEMHSLMGKHAEALRFKEESAAKTAEEVDDSILIKHMRFYAVTQLTSYALAADELSKAKAYAEEALAVASTCDSDWNYGNAIHDGNMVLGQIALRQGDVQSASDYLLRAGATPGSPQLDSYGPTLDLARELLDAGEKDIVIEYLEQCRRFWKLEAGRLDHWIEEIRTTGTSRLSKH